jgi:hypothetical protein
MTAPYPTPQCRLDLAKPAIIFGSALLLSAVFCGAVDSIGSSASIVEDVQVVRAEGAAGGHEADLLVSCQHDRQRTIRDVRCRSLKASRFARAGLH